MSADPFLNKNHYVLKIDGNTISINNILFSQLVKANLEKATIYQSSISSSSSQLVEAKPFPLLLTVITPFSKLPLEETVV